MGSGSGTYGLALPSPEPTTSLPLRRDSVTSRADPIVAAQHRGGQDGDLCLVIQGGACEGQIGDEDRDGEADPRERADPEDPRPGGALREPGQPEPCRQPSEASDAQELADNQPDHDSAGH
jgi:hypothetical protein